MKTFPNKRQEKQKTIQELFKVKNRRKLVKKEQRKEELEKLKEIQTQDNTYYYTLTACVGMIILLSCLAIFGGYTR